MIRVDSKRRTKIFRDNVKTTSKGGEWANHLSYIRSTPLTTKLGNLNYLNYTSIGIN